MCGPGNRPFVGRRAEEAVWSVESKAKDGVGVKGAPVLRRTGCVRWMEWDALWDVSASVGQEDKSR